MKKLRFSEIFSTMQTSLWNFVTLKPQTKIEKMVAREVFLKKISCYRDGAGRMENSQAVDLTRVVFRKDSPRTDPQKEPIIIVGQLAHLHKINFKDVEHKLSPRVTEEVL